MADSTEPVIRAVLDTNVLAPFTIRRDLQHATQDGAFTALWSPWIIAELNRVLTWKWIERRSSKVAGHGHACDLSAANWRHCSTAAATMMDILLATFELVEAPPPYPAAWETLRDLKDTPIWAAAVNGEARYVVSNNTRDYPPRREDGRAVYQSVEYLSASAFLTLLTSSES